MNPFSIQKTPKNLAKELALKFRLLRNKAKFSRKELSARSGVSESSIKRFEITGEIAFVSLLKISQIIKRIEDFDTLFNEDITLEVQKLFSDKMKLK